MERKRSVRRRRYDKPLAKKCKDYCRKLLAFVFSNVGIIGLVVGYTLTGAFIFVEIEGKNQTSMVPIAKAIKFRAAQNVYNLTHDINKKMVIFEEGDFKRQVETIVMNYQQEVIRWVRRGYAGANRPDMSQQWNFPGAFLYSLTVITTIGYGNIFPRTMLGKLTTIVYAIIGMPLFLLYLSNIGDVMAGSFKWVYANLCLCRWCPGVARRRALRAKRRAMQRMSIDECSQDSITTIESWQIVETEETIEMSVMDTESATDSNDVQTVTVPVTICLLIMVGYMCGGALLFSKWEDWHFLDGSYFCFISLSTIGFGDIVPGDKIYTGEVFDLSFIFCAMYLMLGMALIAMCFNLMQEEVIHKIRTTIDTVKYILRCSR